MSIQAAEHISTLRVMNGRGDTSVHWDRRLLAERNPEAMAAVAEAERIFAQAKAGGALAFRVAAGGPAERIDTFDPEARETLLVPAMVGG